MAGKKSVLSMILMNIACLKDDIDALKRLYSEQAKKLIDKEKYDESSNYTSRCSELDNLKAKIDEMVEVFDSLADNEKLDDEGSNCQEDGLTSVKEMDFSARNKRNIEETNHR